MANEDLCAGNVPPIYPPKGKCQCQEEISELRDEMLGRLTDKQDKLTAGEGITIEKVGSDTVISASGTIRMFRPVNELPDASEADENSIYLTPKEGGGVEEWNVIEEGGQKVWNKFGEADIDLTGYVKDEDVTKEYLLERLDYEEIPVSMTTSTETKDYIFLGKENESGCTERVLATGGAMSGCVGDYTIETLGPITWQDKSYTGPVKVILTNCVINGENRGDETLDGDMSSPELGFGWIAYFPAGTTYNYLSDNGDGDVVVLVNEGSEGSCVSFDSITIKNVCPDDCTWRELTVGQGTSINVEYCAPQKDIPQSQLSSAAPDSLLRLTIANAVIDGVNKGTIVVYNDSIHGDDKPTSLLDVVWATKSSHSAPDRGYWAFYAGGDGFIGYEWFGENCGIEMELSYDSIALDYYGCDPIAWMVGGAMSGEVDRHDHVQIGTVDFVGNSPTGHAFLRVTATDCIVDGRQIGEYQEIISWDGGEIMTNLGFTPVGGHAYVRIQPDNRWVEFCCEGEYDNNTISFSAINVEYWNIER